MRSIIRLAVVAALLTGCSTQGFVFKTDTSITVVVPKARTSVTLPVEVSWEDKSAPSHLGVDVHDPNAKYYAIFIDRAPLRPKADLASITPDPAGCRTNPACPDAGTLRDRGVILTDTPTVSIDFLKDTRPSGHKSEKDVHELTIVRMQGDHRTGEAAFQRTFFVRRTQ